MTDPKLISDDGTEYRLATETTIGRGDGVEIQLDDKKVSRRHAVVRRIATGAFEIEDLGSTQGTVVDGRPILVCTRLSNGSEIRIGHKSLRFEDGVDAAGHDAASTGTTEGTPSVLDRPAAPGARVERPRSRTSQRAPSDLARASVALREVDEDVRDRVDSGSALIVVAADQVTDTVDLRERYEQLRAVVELTRAMGAERDLDRLLLRMLEFLCAQVGAEYGAVLLSGPDGADPVPRVSIGPNGPGAQVLVSRTVVREVLANRTSVLSADAGSDARFDGAPSVQTAGLRSVMCVPMRHGDDVLGVVHLHSVGAADAFNRRHLGLAATLATQAAMAVRTALAAEAVEYAQAAERQYLRALVRDLPVALLVLDAARRVQLVNDEAMRVLGAADCREGEPLERLGEHPVATLLPTLATEARELELPGPPRRVVLASAATLHRDLDGESETVLVLRDVTALRDREAKAHLQERLAIVGQLVGGVAHDFNNLLAVMMGYAGVAAHELPPDHPVASYVAEIHSASERAGALVKQLLRIGKPGTTRPEVVNVDHVIDAMRAMLGRTIGEHIAIEYAPGTGPWRVEIDPSRLEQVLLNLVVNARDAIEGQGTIRIATSVVRGAHEGAPDAHDWIRLTVADTGVGMPTEVVDRIFEPFFTTKKRGQGTGLGLATVAEVAQEAHGVVSVASSPGRGATFTVHFPATQREATHEIPQDAAPAPRGDGELVMLVEDEAALRRLMRDILERAGYRVLEARSGAEALRAIEVATEVAVVLTDVVMPGLSGPALARALTASGCTQPVIYMTGYADDALLDHGLDPDGVVLLRKPVAEARLQRALHQAIHRHDAARG